MKLYLSEEQRMCANRLADTVVKQAIDQYAEYLGPHPEPGREINLLKWKPVKSHEGMTMYKSTERRHTALYGALSRRIDPSNDYWTPSAKLLGVGTVFGKLEDAMYGCMTTTELDMSIRSAYVGDDLHEHRVLQHIQLPTHDDPFRYLGIKRVVRSATLGPIRRPREVIFLESAGVRDVRLRCRTRRVGFVAYHSVDVPEFSEAKDHSRTTRGRISSVLLFRQRSNHIVEVFHVMAGNLGGNAGPKLMISTGLSLMATTPRLMSCAFSKKLARELADRMFSESTIRVRDPPTEPRSCTGCRRLISAFRSLVECELCHRHRCYKCISSHSVVFAQSKIKLFQRSVDVCKQCIHRVQQIDMSDALAKSKGGQKSPAFRARRASINLKASTHVTRASESCSRRRRVLPPTTWSKWKNLDRSEQQRVSMYEAAMANSLLQGSDDEDCLEEDLDWIDELGEACAVDEPTVEEARVEEPVHQHRSFEDMLVEMNRLVSTAETTAKLVRTVSMSITGSSIDIGFDDQDRAYFC